MDLREKEHQIQEKDDFISKSLIGDDDQLSQVSMSSHTQQQLQKTASVQENKGFLGNIGGFLFS